MVREIANFRRDVGVDLEKDVLAVFGPTFVLATSAAQSTLFDSKLPDLFVACQLSDAGRATRSLNALLVASGHFAAVRQQVLEGQRIQSLELDPNSSLGLRSVHWCVEGNTLLASNELSLLREGLRGLRGSGIAHVGLKRALAQRQEGTFSAAFTQGDAQRPDSIMLGRRTLAGLQLTSSDGSAAQATAAAMLVAGAASAVAIPNLLEARLLANEKAAISSLSAIHSAQSMARADKQLDVDGDGRGEFLFLDELAGAAPLRTGGPPLADPWLDRGFRFEAPGIAVKTGYRFRVDLRQDYGGSFWSAQDAGANRVSTDLAEQGFVVYAWPERADSGRWAYVLDSQTGLYSTDNKAPQQAYAGANGPKSAAHQASEGFSNDAVRLIGRDGGTWLRLRGP
jgi:type II secretory pathway pseudopilin PulG